MCARSKPDVVHRALDGVGQHGAGDLALDRGPARVPGQGQGQDVVVALQRGQHELPRPPRVDESVQADQRRPGASTVRWGERREHGVVIVPHAEIARPAARW